jgi:hypothetical protein
VAAAAGLKMSRKGHGALPQMIARLEEPLLRTTLILNSACGNLPARQKLRGK